MHAARKFQKTLGWRHSFAYLPWVLAHSVSGVYIAFWLFGFLNSVSLIEQWRVLQESRKIVLRGDTEGYHDAWSCMHCLRSIQFSILPFKDSKLFEKFNCKPSASEPDSKAQPIASAGETAQAVSLTEINGFVGGAPALAGAAAGTAKQANIADHRKTLADLHVNGALTDEAYAKERAITLNGGAPL